MLADVGRWLACRYSRPPVLVGPVGIVPIVSHYARGGRYEAFRVHGQRCDHPRLSGARQGRRGDVELLEKISTPQRCRRLPA